MTDRNIKAGALNRRKILWLGAAATASLYSGSGRAQKRSEQTAPAGDLLVTITLSDGSKHEYRQSAATRLEDYRGPGFTQQNFVSRGDIPNLMVFFRPDANSSRREVVFELGKCDPAGDPSGQLTGATASNMVSRARGRAAYTAQISDGGNLLATVSVPYHWYYSRWRWQSAVRPIANSAAQLLARGLVLPYGQAPGRIEWINHANYVYARPMDNAGITLGMGTTGERADIGPVTEWAAIWILISTLTSSQLAAMTAPNGAPPPTREQAEAMLRATAEASASVPWNYRDIATGAPLDLVKYPTANNYGAAQPQPNLFNPVNLTVVKRDETAAGYTASCADGVMTVSNVAFGKLNVGHGVWVTQGDADAGKIKGVVPSSGLTIASQISGTPGGAGTYQLNAKLDWASTTVYDNPYFVAESGWGPDNAHFPALSPVAFMATGDPYLLEAVQFEAISGYIIDAAQSKPAGQDRRFPAGAALPQPIQTRTFAWTLRSALYARKCAELAETWGTLPSWLLPSSTWKTVTQNAAAYFDDWVNNPTPAGTIFSLATRLNMSEPWEESYLAAVLCMAVLFGYDEWRSAATWKAQREVRYGNGKNGWPQAALAVYAMPMGPSGAMLDPNANLYTLGQIPADQYYGSIAAQWRALTTLRNGQPPWFVSYQNFTQSQINALNSDPTYGGYPALSGINGQNTIVYGSYLVNARGVLALAARFKTPGAADALAIQDRYVARGGHMDARWAFSSS